MKSLSSIAESCGRFFIAVVWNYYFVAGLGVAVVAALAVFCYCALTNECFEKKEFFDITKPSENILPLVGRQKTIYIEDGGYAITKEALSKPFGYQTAIVNDSDFDYVYKLLVTHKHLCYKRKYGFALKGQRTEITFIRKPKPVCETEGFMLVFYWVPKDVYCPKNYCRIKRFVAKNPPDQIDLYTSTGDTEILLSSENSKSSRLKTIFS